MNLNELNGCELVSLANIIAISLSQSLTSDELAVLSGFFNIIGDSLAALSISNSNSPNCST